jgi:hypothetical protein
MLLWLRGQDHRRESRHYRTLLGAGGFINSNKSSLKINAFGICKVTMKDYSNPQELHPYLQ